MNIDLVKQLGIEYLGKVLQNENIIKIFQNEVVISSISKTLELRAKIQEEVEDKVKAMLETLALANIDDLREIERKFLKTGKKLDRALETIETLTENNDELKKEQSLLSEKLDDNFSKLSDLSGLSHLEEELENLARKINSKLDDIKTNSDDIKNLDEDYSEFKNSLAEKSEKEAGYIRDNNNKIKHAKKRMDKISNRVTSLSETLDILKNNNLRVKYQELKELSENRFENLEKKIITLMQTIEEMKKNSVKVDSKNKDTKKAKSEKKTKDTKIVKIEKKTKTKKTEKPKTEKPKTEKPKTEKPKTEKPKTEKPKTEKPKKKTKDTKKPKIENKKDTK